MAAISVISIRTSGLSCGGGGGGGGGGGRSARFAAADNKTAGRESEGEEICDLAEIDRSMLDPVSAPRLQISAQGVNTRVNTCSGLSSRPLHRMTRAAGAQSGPHRVSSASLTRMQRNTQTQSAPADASAGAERRAPRLPDPET
ncbi:unnamed protein product [Merluccius merluccius]